MDIVIYYLVALVLIIVGALCMKKTSAHTRRGGPRYELKRKRRTLGLILLVAALVPLTFGITKQFFSGNGDAPIFLVPTLSGDSGTTPATSPPAPTNNVAAAPPVAPTNSPPPQPVAPKAASPSATDADSVTSLPQHPTADQVNAVLRQAFDLFSQQRIDAALLKVNAVLQADPRNVGAYGLRGDIYATQQHWDKADQDYQEALQLGGKIVPIEFNIAEIDFHLKRYDAAGARYDGLQQDPDMGDLATYRVFLCDLLGGHEDLAAKKLDALNQVGHNPSYYFSNAAWSLYHQKTDDAKSWIASASNIYAPGKFQRYVTGLKALGYPDKLEDNSLSAPDSLIPPGK